MLSQIINILNNINITISDKILSEINTELSLRSLLKTKSSNHLSFLIDYKSKEIIIYSFNLYYISDSFPYSIHSEINTISKYYKKDLKNKIYKNIHKSKKILIILKISKIGNIGNSKPCTTCANYIYNNFDNLNLINVYYSNEKSKLEKLNKHDLLHNTFKKSSGSRFIDK